jgi:hypothetical protein
MYIKSYSELKEKKELKKEQLIYVKTKLYADYFQLAYTATKLRDNGLNWWKKIMFGIRIYKQVREIFRHFKKRKEE